MAGVNEIFSLVGSITVDGFNGVFNNLKKTEDGAKRLAKSFERAGRKVTKFGSTMTKNLTLPIVGAAAGIYKLVEASSDLQETISKTGELFGSNAKDIESWADTAANAFGQSKIQAMDAASTFAIFGKGAGLAGKDLVNFSTTFTELASDLASFNNTSPEEAITAIGAALRGENEPIRRFGVLLDDATMRTKALELGIIDNVKNALTPQQKVMAAQALILEQTKSAQGDFIRTQDGLANSTRILIANFSNLRAELGQKFVPVALKIVNILTEKLVPFIEKISDKIEKIPDDWIVWGTAIAGVTAAIGPLVLIFGQVLTSIGAIITAVKVLIPLMTSLKLIMSTGAYGAAALAITGIAIAIDKTGKAWKKWKDEIGNNVAKKQVDEVLNSVDELLTLYGRLNEADVEFIPEKEFRAAQARVKELENNLGDLGIALEGSAESKMIQLLDVYDEYIEKSDKLNQKTDDTTDAIEKQTESIKANTYELDLNLDHLMKSSKTRQEKMDELQKKMIDAKKEELEEEKKRIDQIDAWQREVDAEEDRRIEEKKRKQEEMAKESIALNKMVFENIIDTAAMGMKTLIDFAQRERDRKYELKLQQIKDSTMTEEEKNKAIEKLERKKFKRDKVKAIMDIQINTLVGMAKTWANVGYPGAIPLTIALGAQSSIATAAVLAQKFEKGGFVKGNEGGVLGMVGEGRESELVLPMESGTKKLADMLMERLGGMRSDNITNNTQRMSKTVVNLNIGTLVADKLGLKKLERMLNEVRIDENLRKGLPAYG